jgi:CheY-like chemotaxis protein
VEERTSAGECILVADSEVLIRHGIADYLRQCGYIVIEAATSDEARTVLSQPDLPVSAVLCDAALEGSLNAFQLRAWTSSQRSELGFILAGNIEAAAKAAARICEDGPHLSRPYDPSLVVDNIKRALAKVR